MLVKSSTKLIPSFDRYQGIDWIKVGNKEEFGIFNISNEDTISLHWCKSSTCIFHSKNKSFQPLIWASKDSWWFISKELIINVDVSSNRIAT